MGKKIASSERISHIRTKIIASLLPDVCEIYTPKRVQNSSGSYSIVDGDRLTYNGTPYIPCRVDISQHYRNDDVLGQEVVLSDFEIHVPYDAPLKADYKIIYKGERYEIRKLLDTQSFNFTKRGVIDRVDIGAK